MIDSEKIKLFISRFPSLVAVAEKLNTAGISWLIGGSGCLFLLGNERVPDDVDIYLFNCEHDKADSLFSIESYQYNSPVESVRNSNPGGDHSIQLTSHLELKLDKNYHFDITDLVYKKSIKFQYEGINFNLLPSEDVLLIKALLQRGPEMGKKDVEDIANFVKIYTIDKDYLNQRIKYLDATDRVSGIF